MGAEQLIAAAIAQRSGDGLSLKAYGAEGYTAEQPFTRHYPTPERRDAGRAELEQVGFTVEAIGEPRIEAWLDAEGRWWTMPYRFQDRGEAEGFLERLRAENPNRTFRLV